MVVTQLFLVSWTLFLLLRFTKISCEPHDFFYITRISKRKDEVVKRRQNVKQLAAERRQELQQSEILQNFKRDTQEVPGCFLSYTLSIESSFIQIVYSNCNNRHFYNRRQNKLKYHFALKSLSDVLPTSLPHPIHAMLWSCSSYL